MKPIQDYRAVIWDMDGTLLNTLGDIAGALNDTLIQWNLPTHSEKKVLEFIGHGAKYLCQCASGLQGEDLDRFHREYRQNSLSRNDPQTHPYPGIAEILSDLHNNDIKIGIYTNKPKEWCTKLAIRFFGAHTFDLIEGTDARNILKPDPTPILDMCKTWHIDPSQAVMIGDSDVDWKTAQNAGCMGICVSYGFRSRQCLVDAGATCIADSVSECRQRLGL